MSRPGILVVCLVLLLSLPLRAPAQELRPAQVRGCYDLQLGKWDSSDGRPPDTLRFLPPPRVEFDTIPFGAGIPDSGTYLVKPAPGSRPSRHRFHSWRIQGDSVYAVWSTGFVGVRVYLGRDSDRLRGRARTFTDAHGPDSRDFKADVIGTKVPCSSAPAFPAASSQFVLRSVPLASGHRIELGSPHPSEDLIQSQRTTRTFVILGKAEGVFSAATEIRVEESWSGLIKEIHLRFPLGTDAEKLRADLEATMGTQARTSPNASGLMAGWEDSATSLSLVSHGRGVDVHLWDPRLF